MTDSNLTTLIDQIERKRHLHFKHISNPSQLRSTLEDLQASKCKNETKEEMVTLTETLIRDKVRCRNPDLIFHIPSNDPNCNERASITADIIQSVGVVSSSGSNCEKQCCNGNELSTGIILLLVVAMVLLTIIIVIAMLYLGFFFSLVVLLLIVTFFVSSLSTYIRDCSKRKKCNCDHRSDRTVNIVEVPSDVLSSARSIDRYLSNNVGSIFIVRIDSKTKMSLISKWLRERPCENAVIFIGDYDHPNSRSINNVDAL